jgi:hypothetical protein
MQYSKALVTLETLQSLAGNALMEAIPLQELAIEVISKKIDEFLYGENGYTTISGTYTKTVNGTGYTRIILPGPPVAGVTKVETRSNGSWSELSNALYTFDTIGVVGFGIPFTPGLSNWRITWTAGYIQTNIPGSIVEVCLEECIRFMEKRADVVSENMGGAASTGRSFLDLDAKSKSKLMMFRRIYV